MAPLVTRECHVHLIVRENVLYQIVVILQIIFAGIGLFVALFRWRKISWVARWAALLLLLSITGDVSSYVLYHVFRINPNIGGNTYGVVVISVYGLIYYQAFNRRYKNFFLIVSALLTLFAAINFIFIQKSALNSYTSLSVSILVTCYGLMYFYWLIRELPTTQLHRLPMFWFNSAFMFYFAGTLILNVSTTYLVNVLKDDLSVFWIFHNVLGIIEFMLIAVGLWVDGRTERDHNLTQKAPAI